MRRLYIKANLHVVSAVYPRDKAVSQLLHKKPNTNELTGNFALAEMDLNHFAPLIMQRHCNALLTRCENVIFRFSETVAPIPRLAIEPEADTLAQLDDLPIDMLVDPISDMMPTKDGKGDRFSMSFQDVIDVVFGHKPLSCSNLLKLIRVFIEVFIKSPVLHSINYKAFDLTNHFNSCFSEGIDRRLLLHRTPHDAQSLDPQHFHRCRSRHTGAPCRVLQPCLLHQGHGHALEK